MRVLFLIGRPNSGKSTQASLLVGDGGHALSPGSWLRDLSGHANESDLGDFVMHNWSHDALSPLVTEYLERCVGEALEQEAAADSSDELVVIDGFPRTALEAEAVPRVCRGNPCLVAELVMDEGASHERGTVRQRGSDDAGPVLDKRLEVYANTSASISTALKNVPVIRVAVEKKTPAQVRDEIAQALDREARRVAIPPVQPPRSIARRLAIEAGPIDSACIFQKCVRLAGSTRPRRQFFGTHPISCTRTKLPRVRRFPYLVARKATGVRFMCFVCNGRLWFLSRALDVYVSKPISGLEPFENSLLDGELIGVEEASYYVVLDCLAFCGVNCMREPILDRLRRSVPLGQHLYHGPIFFRPQEYVDRGQLHGLLRHTYPWETDGVILQPAKLPYRLGIDYNLFKWKPLDKNTADLYYCAADSGLYVRASPPDPKDTNTPQPVNLRAVPRIQSIADGKTELVKFGRLLPAFTPEWVRDGMILECGALDAQRVTTPEAAAELADWEENELVWVPQQHRADKPHPNVDWVAQSVVQSILDNITEAELLATCTGTNLRQTDLPPETAREVPLKNNGKKRALY